MNVPPSLKPVSKYIKRAEDIEKEKSNPSSRLVAYYCYKYALDKVVEITKTDSDASIREFLLNSLLPAVEDRKRALSPPPSPSSDASTVESYALNIFAIAARDDANQSTSKITAKVYYSAGVVLEVLEQFGEPSADVSRIYE